MSGTNPPFPSGTPSDANDHSVDHPAGDRGDDMGQSTNHKVICIGSSDKLPMSQERCEVVEIDASVAVVDQIRDPSFAGVWIPRDQFSMLGELRGLTQAQAMLRDMPEGVALIDSDLRILWANRRLAHWVQEDEKALVGVNLYRALNDPEIMGPDFCPFHTALATGEESSSTLRASDNRYFQVHAAPLNAGPSDTSDGQSRLVITIGDITKEMLQQQKLQAIHQAGRDLADLRPSEVFLMEVDERIELLKDNIRSYLRDLLNFEVVEIRLLEQSSGNLVPLLSVGIDQDAADRQLYAHPQGNGVTGYVASSGEAYICHDVENDPLFIPGVVTSRSSITAPLILHDQVLGTLNVESPEPNAFSDSDLQFLEIFSRDVAFALNTLELLVAQKANTAQQSCDAIHSAVAMPVDEILNDAVNVMEGYVGLKGEVVDRLRHILKNARDIKRTIQQIGQTMTPLEAVPAGSNQSQFQMLSGKRILVVDADDQTREDAHRLLERYGCIVETAHKGDEAVLMYRGSGGAGAYDVVISDINLPDYSGHQLMVRLGKFMDHVPMILMQGFGYDPGHSVVKARQKGMPAKCVLYKPFRLDQLIEALQTAILHSEAQNNREAQNSHEAQHEASAENVSKVAK